MNSTYTKVPKVTQNVVHTVVQKQVQPVEVVKPTVIRKTVQRKKPIIQENIKQVPKVVQQAVPVQKVVQAAASCREFRHALFIVCFFPKV